MFVSAMCTQPGFCPSHIIALVARKTCALLRFLVSSYRFFWLRIKIHNVNLLVVHYLQNFWISWRIPLFETMFWTRRTESGRKKETQSRRKDKIRSSRSCGVSLAFSWRDLPTEKWHAPLKVFIFLSIFKRFSEFFKFKNVFSTKKHRISKNKKNCIIFLTKVLCFCCKTHRELFYLADVLVTIEKKSKFHSNSYISHILQVFMLDIVSFRHNFFIFSSNFSNSSAVLCFSTATSNVLTSSGSGQFSSFGQTWKIKICNFYNAYMRNLQNKAE